MDLPELPDDAVIARVLANEPQLFETLIRRCNEPLYRAVRAVLKDDTETEDVMQEAYVAAFRNLAQFAGDSAFCTWLVRIGINAAIARVRKHGRSVNLGEDSADVAEPTKTPEQQLSRRAALAQLEQAVDELPDAYRLVLVLRDVDGLSTRETAEALGLTEDNVKVRLHRARSWLKARLGETSPDLLEAFEFEQSRCDRVARNVLATTA